MLYKEVVKDEMTQLASYDNTVFIGEGIINAGRLYGTLDNVPTTKCIEMPVAENLIAGCGLGLAMTGFVPIIVFQRMDFMLNAADAIINHIALAIRLSGGNLKIPMIIRAVVGSMDKSFDVGPQHQHDFAQVFSNYIQTFKAEDISYIKLYNQLMGLDAQCPVMVIEYKDMYEKELNDAIER